MSLKDAIFTIDDRPGIPADVPEWGTIVKLRPISLGQRTKLAALYGDGAGRTGHEVNEELALRLVVYGCHDDAGNRLFDDSPQDLDALRAKNPAVIDRLASMVGELSGIGPSAVDRAEKNSESEPN